MPLWDRIARLFEEDATPGRLSERVRTGLLGEEHATDIIGRTQPPFHRANVIVPGEGDSGRVQETDHVVLWGGTVFVVEVKNYKGALHWAEESKSALLQYKTGRYGETVAPKPARNPLAQAKSFIHGVKQYLSRHVDARFQRLRVQPVGAFTRAADIAPIYDRVQGLIYVDELPAYFAAHQDPRFGQRPSAWVRQGLAQLPSLDAVVDGRGQTHLGLLAGPALQYGMANGIWYECLWENWAWVEVQPATGFFSEQDGLVLRWREGGSSETKFRHGLIRLRTLEGEWKPMLLRGLHGIAPAPVRLPTGAHPRRSTPAAAGSEATRRSIS